MMNNGIGMTPADMAAVMRDNDGFGSNDSWIWLFLIFAIFGGWGNGGYGNNGINENYVLASDFATMQRLLGDGFNRLESKGDAIANGLCDGFYSTNMNMANGFAQAELARANNQSTLLQQLNANNVMTLQGQNALQAQLADCCCQNRYDALQNTNVLQNAISTGFCQTNFNDANNTRDIIDNQNANTRAIIEALNEQQVSNLKEKIACLTADNQALRFASSQHAQNAYLIDQLRTPNPIPAYVVQNPYCNCNNGFNGYGYYSGTTVS